MGTIDIKMSESGSNAHYFHCDTKQQRCNYAVCLNLIKNKKNGTLRPQHDRQNCEMSIDKAECPAVDMRREEVKAKDALYYVAKDSRFEANQSKSANYRESYHKGYNMVKNDGVVKQPVKANNPSKPKFTKKLCPDEMEVDIAKAITNAVKEETVKLAKEEIEATPAKSKKQQPPKTATKPKVIDALALMTGAQ